MINKTLAQEILGMARLDQSVRKLGKEMSHVDQKNLVRMKQIVAAFGWPVISLVGKRASHMAWLLVQHADTDLKFQEYCLSLMKEAAKNKEVMLSDVAYLTDRVLVNQGKSQIYGTQFYKPIRDRQNLDTRRASMGLSPA